MANLGENLNYLQPEQPPKEQGATGAYYGDACNAKAQRESTLREQAEKQVGYHREQADKSDRAAAFFRDNPAFDEFVRLLRSGAIQF